MLLVLSTVYFYPWKTWPFKTLIRIWFLCGDKGLSHSALCEVKVTGRSTEGQLSFHIVSEPQEWLPWLMAHGSWLMAHHHNHHHHHHHQWNDSDMFGVWRCYFNLLLLSSGNRVLRCCHTVHNVWLKCCVARRQPDVCVSMLSQQQVASTESQAHSIDLTICTRCWDTFQSQSVTVSWLNLQMLFEKLLHCIHSMGGRIGTKY